MSKPLREMFEHMHDIFKSDDKDAISEYYDKCYEASLLKLEDIILKQISLKPISKENDTIDLTDLYFHLCPECGEKVGRSMLGIKMNYCPQCGQILDWSEE